MNKLYKELYIKLKTTAINWIEWNDRNQKWLIFGLKVEEWSTESAERPAIEEDSEWAVIEQVKWRQPLHSFRV